MNFRMFDNGCEFKARTWPFLLAHEAENNLMIGIAEGLASGRATADPDPARRPTFCVVTEGDVVLAAAVQTPPHRIVLTRGPQEALNLMARRLRNHSISFRGVLAPCASAQAFSDAWKQVTGQDSRRESALRIDQLDCVTPANRAAGEMVEAAEADLDLAVEWMRGFQRDVRETAHACAQDLPRKDDREVQQLRADQPEHGCQRGGAEGLRQAA